MSETTLRKLSGKELTVKNRHYTPPGGQQVTTTSPAVVAEHAYDIKVDIGVDRSFVRNRALAVVVAAFAVDIVEALQAGDLSYDDLYKMAANRLPTTEHKQNETK